LSQYLKATREGLEVVPAINIFVYSPPVPFGRASAAWANRTREKRDRIEKEELGRSQS
jgi:hypothetical protein